MTRRNSNWPDYAPRSFEGELQQWWEQQGLFRASENGEKPKFYCLDFFPYPSGDGLHVGHCRNYLPTDVLSRYKRMTGFEVLHPMGWDAFGEPAEQYAVAHGTHPRVTTAHNTANFKRQMNLIGASYDWSREITSSDPEFYRWTQWFFLLLYRRGLAYRDTNYQWWCPVCQTTLSGHEAAGGVCWRGHTGLTRREMPAWYFKITAYADELLDGLDELDWPEAIKAMQRNWIGRSEGAEIDFPVVNSKEGEVVSVFTTRPDTLFGATYFILAPEHRMVPRLTAADRQAEVNAYIEQASRQSDIYRMQEDRQKTGVFTGGYVINPVNGEPLPVWVADYVLVTYGTGAVMGVPAHDRRDFDFARQYGLPVRTVILPAGEPIPQDGEQESAYVEDGVLVNSGPFDGLPTREAGEQIVASLEAHGKARRAVNYHMHDWLISRQRYWGTPIPIVYCEQCGEAPVPEADLPVLLPDLNDFQPDGSGRSPLARLPEFVNTTCPACGGPAQRETDTMGGFACSSWYFLRFASPHYEDGPFEEEAMRYWLPVDLYVGGAEHAVLHLLYARFWTRVMADEGLVPFREPFPKLRNQGQMMGVDGSRMSKSRGNVITPDWVVNRYGADALRVYTLFMAPFEQDVSWSTDGINGASRFVTRLWNLYRETYHASAGSRERDPGLERELHQTIRQVSERIETFRMNTMVSALMQFTNTLQARLRDGRWRTATFHEALDKLMVLIAPTTPYLVEELWRRTGHQGSVHRQPWPAWDPELSREESAQIAVQINGKVRAVIEVPASAAQAEVEEIALAQEQVQNQLRGQTVSRTIYVPGKILNLVIGR